MLTQQLENSCATELERTCHSLCKEDREKRKVSARDMGHIKAKQESPQVLNTRQKDKAPLAGDRRGKGRKTKHERSTAEHACSTQPERQAMLPIESSSITAKPHFSG